MDGVKHFSDFFKNKKELPKFDKHELLNDFFLEEDVDTESESEDAGRRTAISNFPHIAKEESDKRNQRVERSYKEDPDGMYPRDSERYDTTDTQSGWQDGMGAPPSSSNESKFIDKDEIDRLIQKQINKIKNQTILENKIDENQEIVLPLEVQDEGQEEHDEEQIVESNTDYYKLYNDKSETFSCEIELEGANLSDTMVRLIVESDNWNLMFPGEIDRNGRVSIPIRKLNILEEGTKGRIKMEVIAEGTVFTPWEDDFEVKMSKKVMVKFNENKTTPKPKTITKPGVKVNFKK
jgi:hypothetical protein